MTEERQKEDEQKNQRRTEWQMAWPKESSRRSTTLPRLSKHHFFYWLFLLLVLALMRLVTKVIAWHTNLLLFTCAVGVVGMHCVPRSTGPCRRGPFLYNELGEKCLSKTN